MTVEDAVDQLVRYEGVRAALAATDNADCRLLSNWLQSSYLPACENGTVTVELPREDREFVALLERAKAAARPEFQRRRLIAIGSELHHLQFRARNLLHRLQREIRPEAMSEALTREIVYLEEALGPEET
jgi:hypothetical protein